MSVYCIHCFSYPLTAFVLSRVRNVLQWNMHGHGSDSTWQCCRIYTLTIAGSLCKFAVEAFCLQLPFCAREHKVYHQPQTRLYTSPSLTTRSVSTHCFLFFVLLRLSLRDSFLCNYVYSRDRHKEQEVKINHKRTAHKIWSHIWDRTFKDYLNWFMHLRQQKCYIFSTLLHWVICFVIPDGCTCTVK